MATAVQKKLKASFKIYIYRMRLELLMRSARTPWCSRALHLGRGLSHFPDASDDSVSDNDPAFNDDSVFNDDPIFDDDSTFNDNPAFNDDSISDSSDIKSKFSLFSSSNI